MLKIMTPTKKYLIIGAIILLLLISKKVSAEKLIAKFEGLKLTAYPDTGGIWTIGYGNTFNPITGVKVKQGDKITKATALEWLKKDIEQRQIPIKKLVKVPINANQLAALTSLAYNIGLGAFQKSCILSNLNNKNIKEAANCFLLYNKGRKNGILVVIPGLNKRRQLERELFLT